MSESTFARIVKAVTRYNREKPLRDMVRRLAAILAVLALGACSLPDIHTAAKEKAANLVTHGGGGRNGKR